MVALSAIQASPEDEDVNLKVLIVDDDPDFSEGLEIVLSSRNYLVGHAASRADAVDECGRLDPDVALIDLRLAGSDGTDLIADLRAGRPGLLCIMMTGYASAESAIRALQEGAFDYLTKPIQTGDLIAALDRCGKHIELQRARDAADAALRESQRAFQNMIDHAPVSFTLKDVDGRFQVVNRLFADWFGWPIESLIGKTADDILNKDVVDRIVAHENELIRTKAVSQKEYDLELADGKTHTVIMTKYPVLDDQGQLVGMGTINTDVTHTRQVELQLQQSQKLDAIGKLTGGIAHDLNNILAVIQAGVELLADQKSHSPDLIRTILSATMRGSDLIDRLMAFSRQQSLQPQAVDLQKLLTEMADILSRTLGETITLELDTARGLWPVEADPRQVENAVLNLAVNARDAMPRGGRLTIACSNVHLEDGDSRLNPDLTPGDYVVLAVADTGIGMSEHVRSHVFEPFFTTKGPEGGTGLGLSMVYGFAQQSGGMASIESEENVGTTVKLYLPRTELELTVETAEDVHPIPRGQSELILLIEDNPDFRLMTASLLDSLGYRHVAAADALEARNVLHERDDIDLILSDVVLPGGTSGPELIEEILGSRPDLRYLFMSGYALEANQSDTLRTADNLLAKPFKRQDLADALCAALAEPARVCH